MTESRDHDLEQRFADHHIPLRRLYPWWYRLYHRLGLQPKPPVLFTLAEHFRYEGASVAVIFAVGCLVTRLFLSTPVQALVPLFLMIFLAPLWSWWSYRRIRRRIGL